MTPRRATAAGLACGAVVGVALAGLAAGGAPDPARRPAPQALPPPPVQALRIPAPRGIDAAARIAEWAPVRRVAVARR